MQLDAEPRRRASYGWLAQRALAFLLVGCALMLFWAWLLHHNLARAEKLTDVVTDQKARNLIVLSADFLEYRDYYKAFPLHFRDMSEGNSYVEYSKRPLYGPVSAALTVFAHRLLGVMFPDNLYLILSLYAAGCSLLMFWLCRGLGLPQLEAVLLAAAATASFSWLSTFSLPESYSLTVCGALLAAISGSRLPALDRKGSWRACLRHASVVGVMSWLYLPICGASLLVLSGLRRRQHWLTRVIPTISLAVAITMLPHVWRGKTNLQEQIDYGQRWSSPTYLYDANLVGRVVAAFLVFGLVSPVDDFVSAPAEMNVRGALQRASTAAGAIGLVICYMWLGWAVVRSGTFRRLEGVLGWLASLCIFHVFFNPHEVLLYTAVPTAVVLSAVGTGLAQVYAARSSPLLRRCVVGSLVAAVGVLIGSNWRPIVGL